MLRVGMSRPYGKISRKGAQKPTPPPAEIQMNFAGRHTLEQITHEFQKAMAILQEHDVIGVQKFRMRFEPLDGQGQGIALWDAAGQPIAVMNIPDIPAPPPYREDR